jgi:hypothetical protein
MYGIKQRCCYITVDFATAASQNGVCMTQQMCRIMIYLHDCFMIKKKMKLNVFCQMFLSFINNSGFLMKGKLISTKSVL